MSNLIFMCLVLWDPRPKTQDPNPKTQDPDCRTQDPNPKTQIPANVYAPEHFSRYKMDEMGKNKKILVNL